MPQKEIGTCVKCHVKGRYINYLGLCKICNSENKPDSIKMKNHKVNLKSNAYPYLKALAEDDLNVK